ncbi:MAG: hypothetical protein Q3974_06500 [Rothia sp. (in: high G+C Gram-positive bacteria)]|nr:hypothetical protein [Rothia sp. (in: high G+C Gram-positive bacteria)]
MIDALIKILTVTPALIGLGLMMGFSPSLYSITFLALIKDPKQLHIARWLALGIFAGATLLILLFRIINPQNLITLVHGETHKLILTSSIDACAGILLLIVAIVLWMRRNHPHKAHRVAGSQLHRGKAILEGFFNSAVSISSVATMYVVGRTISSVSENLFQWILTYAIFSVVLLAPYLGIEAGWNKYPELRHKVITGLNWLKTAHLSGMYAFILAIAGTVFLFLAVSKKLIL